MSESSKENAEREPKPPRIVLVEDNDGDVRLLEKALRAAGIAYELILFEDGEQAMTAMSSDPTLVPDLILVDLNLPRREGYEVLRMVLAMPRLSGIPVGVLTSSSAEKDRNRSAIMGVTKYIHKPPTLDEFVKQVGTAVGELLSGRKR